MKKTQWRGAEYPPTFTKRQNVGQWQITLYADVQKTTTEQGSEEYTATQITLPVGVYDYASIVSAIIDAHYTADQMQAIVNNYLIDEDEEAFRTMQEYRVYAKGIAHTIVDALAPKGVEEEPKAKAKKKRIIGGILL